MAKTYSAKTISTPFSSPNDGEHDPLNINKVDTPFLAAAILSLIASVTLWFLVDKLTGIFVGIWVPSVLALWCGIRSKVNHSK